MTTKTFDTRVPASLKHLQIWFGSIIRQPLREDQSIQPRSPSRTHIRPEAARYIRPSNSLAPYQRIQIYNQQYWWRLLKNLRENFPTILALLGKRQFDLLVAYPYFIAHPPDHWALIKLGPQLARWVKEKYNGPHTQLVYEAALVDYACNLSFVAAHHQPISGSPEELSSQSLFLQPHFHLFSFGHDFMRWRTVLLEQEEPDYWLTHPLPELDQARSFYFVLFRNSEGLVIWREISEAAHFILNCFKKGSSIDQLCTLLETQSDAIQEEAAANLQVWMQEWVGSEWLTVSQP